MYQQMVTSSDPGTHWCFFFAGVIAMALIYLVIIVMDEIGKDIDKKVRHIPVAPKPKTRIAQRRNKKDRRRK